MKESLYLETSVISYFTTSLNEVMIMESKGSKDRIVPLGQVCGQYMWKWVYHEYEEVLERIEDAEALEILKKKRGVA